MKIKFEIKRSSDYTGKEQPLPGAYLAQEDGIFKTWAIDLTMEEVLILSVSTMQGVVLSKAENGFAEYSLTLWDSISL